MKVSSLKENLEVDGIYLVKAKTLSKAKNGSMFLNMDVIDDTGEINCKVWNEAERFSSVFEKGDIVKISGKIVKFKDKLQISVSGIRPVQESDNVKKEDFLPTTKHCVETMIKSLHDILSTIENDYIKSLVLLFLEDTDFLFAFKKSVAAKEMHHNYRGGLLEHTLSVVKICNFLGTHFPGVNKDILLAVAFLHDIGKTREIDSDGEFDYTVEGNLKGHIMIGLEMIHEKMSEIDGFPYELRLKIEHGIISHHGELEWGAPVVPKTPEAIIVHYADNVDAKTMRVLCGIDKCKDESSLFTPYDNALKRTFFKG